MRAVIYARYSSENQWMERRETSQVPHQPCCSQGCDGADDQRSPAAVEPQLELLYRLADPAERVGKRVKQRHAGVDRPRFAGPWAPVRRGH